jgi:hypothetical protein
MKMCPVVLKYHEYGDGWTEQLIMGALRIIKTETRKVPGEKQLILKQLQSHFKKEYLFYP